MHDLYSYQDFRKTFYSESNVDATAVNESDLVSKEKLFILVGDVSMIILCQRETLFLNHPRTIEPVKRNPTR